MAGRCGGGGAGAVPEGEVVGGGTGRRSVAGPYLHGTMRTDLTFADDVGEVEPAKLVGQSTQHVLRKHR